MKNSKAICTLISPLVLFVFLAGCKQSELDEPNAATMQGLGADQGDGEVVTSGGAFDSEVLEQRMLTAVNNVRSQPQQCDTTRDCNEDGCAVDEMPAVADIAWSERLEAAALIHSTDMAENMGNNQQLSHTGTDNSTIAERVTSQNYVWNLVLENIAGGSDTPEAVVNAWLGSNTGHCQAMMNGTVTEMGVSAVFKAGSVYGHYWTQVFAKPSTGG